MNAPGFDALLFINLTTNGFLSPQMTLGGTLQDLLTRGWANNPAFGGSGPMVVGTLAGQAVYGTLVPTGSTVNPAVQVTSSTSNLTFSASAAASQPTDKRCTSRLSPRRSRWLCWDCLAWRWLRGAAGGKR